MAKNIYLRLEDDEGQAVEEYAKQQGFHSAPAYARWLIFQDMGNKSHWGKIERMLANIYAKVSGEESK